MEQDTAHRVSPGLGQGQVWPWRTGFGVGKVERATSALAVVM